jgi:hypothetical protein
MEPLPPGLTDDLTGMNVSYDRSALGAIEDLLAAGRWESDLHPRLRSQGYELWVAPGAVIEHAKDFGFREFASQRYHYSRSFAGMRADVRGPKRLIYALATPLLVPILFWRILRHVRSRPGYQGAFRKATPLVLVYTSIWAVGELIGYIFGGGSSILRVR